MGRIKPRWFRSNLQAALRALPVTVLTGARQTGKTTLTQAIEPARVEWNAFRLYLRGEEPRSDCDSLIFKFHGLLFSS